MTILKRILELSALKTAIHNRVSYPIKINSSEIIYDISVISDIICLTIS